MQVIEEQTAFGVKHTFEVAKKRFLHFFQVIDKADEQEMLRIGFRKWNEVQNGVYAESITNVFRNHKLILSESDFSRIRMAMPCEKISFDGDCIRFCSCVKFDYFFRIETANIDLKRVTQIKLTISSDFAEYFNPAPGSTVSLSTRPLAGKEFFLSIAFYSDSAEAFSYVALHNAFGEGYQDEILQRVSRITDMIKSANDLKDAIGRFGFGEFEIKVIRMKSF